MKRRLLLAPILGLLCSPLADGRALPPSYATPQATVASYWLRMIERRHAAALDCFAEFDAHDVSNMLALPNLVELRCRDFELGFQGRGVVDVAYRVEYRIAMGEPLTSFSTGDRLQLTGRGWKIARPLLVASQRP